MQLNNVPSGEGNLVSVTPSTGTQQIIPERPLTGGRIAGDVWENRQSRLPEASATLRPSVQRVPVKENLFITPSNLAIDSSVRNLILDREKRLLGQGAVVDGLSAFATGIIGLFLGGNSVDPFHHLLSGFNPVKLAIALAVPAIFGIQAITKLDKRADLQAEASKLKQLLEDEASIQQESYYPGDAAYSA